MREVRIEDLLQGQAVHEEDPLLRLSMLSATLWVDGDPEVISDSIGPEAGRELPRTRTTVRREGDATVVEIHAADSSSMRAALNSYLECIRIIEDIHRVAEVRP